MEIVIDTHALIWYLTGDKKLGKEAKRRIDGLYKAQNHLIISLVVLMEVLILIEKKRVKFTWEEFNQKISELPNVIVYPIGMDVIEVLRKYGRDLELHDRILVATAIIHKAVIISKDHEIAAVKEIRTIW